MILCNIGDVFIFEHGLYVSALKHVRMLILERFLSKNILAVYFFCKTGLYICIIIINTKLLYDLKSIKHKHFSFTCVSSAQTDLRVRYTTVRPISGNL